MTEWVGRVGTEVVWLAVGAGFVLLAATWQAVGAFLDRPVPAWRAAAGAAAALPLVGGLAAISARAPDLRLGLTTAAVVALVAPLLFGPTLAVTASACTFAAARRPGARGQWPVALAAAAPLWLAAAAVLAGGLAASDPAYAAVRAAAYAALSVVVAAAAVGARLGAADFAVGGAVVAPIAVALGEASQRGLVLLLVVLKRGDVADAQWAVAVDQMVAHVRPEWLAAWVALGAAVGCPLVPAVAARHLGGAALAAWVAALGAAVLLAIQLAVLRLPGLGG